MNGQTTTTHSRTSWTRIVCFQAVAVQIGATHTLRSKHCKKNLLNCLHQCAECTVTVPKNQHMQTCGKNGLVPVPPEAANTLKTAFYPDGAELMRVTPLWFSEAIGELVQGTEALIPVVDVQNVWDVFSSILSLIKEYDQSCLSNSSNDPSLTISAQ
ncbi:hypothetical protein VP01_10759g1 [Puccinia sorghi]|uniref:Uncharacterized protein n=1 Tax=Puccinia sorghi TaxID=27349 RepID=A0A0L6VTI8_9BASI|nr:hypothetical protein VP01_10759g1 [Puccinia sorghi]